MVRCANSVPLRVGSCSVCRVSRARQDRYDVEGNPEAEFIDAEHTVLANLRGIDDLTELQIIEEEELAKAYEVLLNQVRTDTPLTNELVRHIHATIFGDIFEWAGRWRTVQISKPGAIWPPPQYLDAAMKAFEQDVLRPIRSHDLLTLAF